MARPRGIDDEAILRAAAGVIGRAGPGGLTLAAVAREVGLVPGTVVQRFGSKRGLLVALAESSVREAEGAARRVRERCGSALEALGELIVESAAVMATPESYANHLAALCGDLVDDELREHALAVHKAHGRAIATLLTEAEMTGALRRGTDVAALAWSVQSMVAGVGVVWALERRGTLADRLRRETGRLIAPHVA
ncbi:TetR/AcrR family transcriptional regulator [Kitasatospora sp. NPDC006697]|uniref:TetR/AcrR family transcriptional regulator n=1 Tax=Kitasatospora sp. NPDC006697 TaxID=3364020 RepID=UPI003682816E